METVLSRPTLGGKPAISTKYNRIINAGGYDLYGVPFHEGDIYFFALFNIVSRIAALALLLPPNFGPFITSSSFFPPTFLLGG